MALSGSWEGVGYDSALGMIRQNPDITVGEMIRRLRDRFDEASGTVSDWGNLARQVKRNYEHARNRTGEDGSDTEAQRIRNMPLDPTARRDNDAFRWRVVVKITYDDGTTSDVFVVVNSPRYLNLAEVFDEAVRLVRTAGVGSEYIDTGKGIQVMDPIYLTGGRGA